MFFSYQPTAAIAAIHDQVGFTDKGTFMFYTSHPEVDDRNAFNIHCDRHEQSTAVLGCYVAGRIHIYDITDKRLAGIREVTSAHEMLHVVYQRLPRDEKSAINKLLESEYEKVKDDPAFTERMEFYARTEPGERSNELHSIVGTEFRDISSQLEEHYEKYFKDRSKILELYESYSSLFSSLAKQAKELAAQLDLLDKQIQSETERYNQLVQQLNDDIADFNRQAIAGDFDSQAQFNSERRALQLRVDTVSQLRTSINAMIAEYESYRTRYNETVAQTRGLYQSIDSKLAPAPKV